MTHIAPLGMRRVNSSQESDLHLKGPVSLPAQPTPLTSPPAPNPHPLRSVSQITVGRGSGGAASPSHCTFSPPRKTTPTPQRADTIAFLFHCSQSQQAASSALQESSGALLPALCCHILPLQQYRRHFSGCPAPVNACFELDAVEMPCS